jgi:hypothetical protein
MALGGIVDMLINIQSSISSNLDMKLTAELGILTRRLSAIESAHSSVAAAAAVSISPMARRNLQLDRRILVPELGM